MSPSYGNVQEPAILQLATPEGTSIEVNFEEKGELNLFCPLPDMQIGSCLPEADNYEILSDDKVIRNLKSFIQSENSPTVPLIPFQPSSSETVSYQDDDKDRFDDFICFSSK